MQRLPEPIRSRSNPLVRRLRSLKRGAKVQGFALLEGAKLLEEAVAAGIEVSGVVVSAQAAGDARVRRALEAAGKRGAAVRMLDEAILASLSEVETSQGVLALARRPAFRDEQLFAGTPLLVVAVAVQNPGNLGGLLRSAEAAGATGALITEGSADPFSWKALRGSMGSAFRLPHLSGLTLEAALRMLKARAVVSVAAATTGTSYDAADLRGPVAFFFGNEGAGLPEQAQAAADLRVAIPMAGAVESLNVGVAAGILLFEAARQRRQHAR